MKTHKIYSLKAHATFFVLALMALVPTAPSYATSDASTEQAIKTALDELNKDPKFQKANLEWLFSMTSNVRQILSADITTLAQKTAADNRLKSLENLALVKWHAISNLLDQHKAKKLVWWWGQTRAVHNAVIDYLKPYDNAWYDLVRGEVPDLTKVPGYQEFMAQREANLATT